VPNGARFFDSVWRLYPAEKPVSEQQRGVSKMQSVTEVEPTPPAAAPKLFYVTSTGIVNGFHNVPIDWFAVRSSGDRDPNLPWAAMIEGYKPGLGETKYWSAKEGVAEMFTEAEAKVLVEYLRNTDPEGAAFMEPIDLPVHSLCSTEEWVGATDGRIIFLLSDRHGLPFPVRGYCRLSGRLLIREEKSGGFVVYKDEVPISTPFADCPAAEAWISHLLGEQLSRFC
jgi:hypothetical protein